MGRPRNAIGMLLLVYCCTADIKRALTRVQFLALLFFAAAAAAGQEDWWMRLLTLIAMNVRCQEYCKPRPLPRCSFVLRARGLGVVAGVFVHSRQV